jgi:hypothetical protein
MSKRKVVQRTVKVFWGSEGVGKEWTSRGRKETMTDKEKDKEMITKRRE